MAKKQKGGLGIDARGMLIARQGRRTVETTLEVGGLVGRLADSLREGTGLHWGNDIRVLAPAAGGVTKVTVGGADGVTVPLSAEEARELADRIDPPSKNPDEPYIRFRETNNWEMERWSFYIPLRGNEEAVRILMAVSKSIKQKSGCFLGDHVPYDVRTIPTPEAEVDRVCRRCRSRGYMASHNKLEGRLDLRMVKAAAARIRKDGDQFYKGGLKGMMKPWRGRPAKADWPTGRHMAALKRLPVRKLCERTAGRLMEARGWGAAGGFHPGPARRHMSFKERCFDAAARLEDRGLRTAGDIAKLTKAQLLATPGVGRSTVNLAEWMLWDAGLSLTKKGS